MCLAFMRWLGHSIQEGGLDIKDYPNVKGRLDRHSWVSSLYLHLPISILTCEKEICVTGEAAILINAKLTGKQYKL